MKTGPKVRTLSKNAVKPPAPCFDVKYEKGEMIITILKKGMYEFNGGGILKKGQVIKVPAGCYFRIECIEEGGG